MTDDEFPETIYVTSEEDSDSDPYFVAHQSLGNPIESDQRVAVYKLVKVGIHVVTHALEEEETP